MRRDLAGFSLVELAVVLAIIGLVIAGGMATLSSQTIVRTNTETLARLNAAADAVIGFAIVNRRLPCPATATSGVANGSSATTGIESFSSGSAATGGGSCTSSFGGYLPAQSIGFTPVDSYGFAVDSWGNRIRYAVAGSVALTGCTGSSTIPHFTQQATLKTNGLSCMPGTMDLDVCQTSVGITATSCNTAARVANQSTVAFIIFSTGQNGAVASSYGVDETANTNGDAVFISRVQSDSTSAQGTFDDLVVIVPAGVVYEKLVNAGALP
ncbi:MAG TPA: prepilin-type N-terminal cleavage/methylation domain-containing protein [Burkholderiales bacterium]|nr:prepilin-type N-terminal cleavage/methylation domain-containing protein [Burkholderiales bacterium]